MPSSTWKLHLSNTNKHFTLRSHEAKTWKTRWGLQNAFFGWQGGGARQNALLKVAAKQYLAILLKAWICFIFYALFSNVILMLYFDALFWYFILTLYFDTLFWHFILTLLINTWRNSITNKQTDGRTDNANIKVASWLKTSYALRMSDQQS